VKIYDYITQQSQWDISRLKIVLNSHPIIQKIQGIAIPMHETKDSFCWGLNSSGDFSTKSATWMAHGIQSHETSKCSYKWKWKIDIMPKILIFLW